MAFYAIIHNGSNVRKKFKLIKGAFVSAGGAGKVLLMRARGSGHNSRGARPVAGKQVCRYNQGLAR